MIFDASGTATGGVPTAVVLHPAVDVVGIGQIDTDVVKLAERQVVPHAKGGAAVKALVHPTVGSNQYMLAVIRIEPGSMQIGVDTAVQCAPGSPGILRNCRDPTGLQHDAVVARIHDQVGEVEGPYLIIGAAINKFPAVATVGATVETFSFLRSGLDRSVHYVRLTRGDGYTDPAQRLVGQTVQ